MPADMLLGAAFWLSQNILFYEKSGQSGFLPGLFSPLWGRGLEGWIAYPRRFASERKSRGVPASSR